MRDCLWKHFAKDQAAFNINIDKYGSMNFSPN